MLPTSPRLDVRDKQRHFDLTLNRLQRDSHGERTELELRDQVRQGHWDTIHPGHLGSAKGSARQDTETALTPGQLSTMDRDWDGKGS